MVAVGITKRALVFLVARWELAYMLTAIQTLYKCRLSVSSNPALSVANIGAWARAVQALARGEGLKGLPTHEAYSIYFSTLEADWPLCLSNIGTHLRACQMSFSCSLGTDKQRAANRTRAFFSLIVLAICTTAVIGTAYSFVLGRWYIKVFAAMNTFTISHIYLFVMLYINYIIKTQSMQCRASERRRRI